MAKRRKAAKRVKRRKVTRTVAQPTQASGLIQAAERAVLSQSATMLRAANKRYNSLVRQAARATNSASKRKYLAAALSAVVIAGVVANDLKRRLGQRPAAGRKKRR